MHNRQTKLHYVITDLMLVIHTMYAHTHMNTACMREQLAQALATQQALTVERDQAKEQCRLAQERATKLETQLILLRQVHGEFGLVIVRCFLIDTFNFSSHPVF